jgi:hypothetical protein
MSARNPTLGEAAIGPRDGDTLELRNQWARVAITVQIDDSQRTAPAEYVVTGDLYDLREVAQTFRTMGAAITYAMKSLAIYQEGRA